VDRFRIINNIRHFRHRLSSELDSARRAQMQKQLVEEMALIARRMPAASRERATGVMPNSPATAIISSVAAAAILTRGLAHAFPSADLTMSRA
jgi:hypothetical protein